MSTLYQSSKDVPTEVLSARLNQLADVVSSNRERIDAEFTMRIPAECDRDADLVMSEAAVRLEALQAECEKLRTALAESRANDLTAMGYLNQIRQLVGGDDFPDMVERVAKLQAECEKLRNLLRHAQPIIKAHAEASHMLEGFRPRRNKWDELVEGIHAVMQEPSHENQ